MSKPFDPRQYIRQLDNGAPYLDVKWRLHWLRSEHPEAEIETELLSIDEESAVCKATVRIPGSGTATGHASANRGNNPSYIETAETRAIGRALAALGYGAEFVDDDLIASRPGPPPVALVPSQPRQPPRPAPGSFDRGEPAELPGRSERPIPEPAPAVFPEAKADDTFVAPDAPVTTNSSAVRPIRRGDRDDEPVGDASRLERSERPEQREPRQPRQPREMRETVDAHERPTVPGRDVSPDATPEEMIGELPTPLSRGTDIRSRQSAQPRGNAPQAREDVNWSKFWEWAKRRGYRDAQHLKDLLDIDVNAHTPGEVRDYIRRYEQKNPPDQG